jgi:hypothetical protein
MSVRVARYIFGLSIPSTTGYEPFRFSKQFRNHWPESFSGKAPKKSPLVSDGNLIFSRFYKREKKVFDQKCSPKKM